MRGGRNTGRIFSRPTWRSVLFSPRGIAVLLVIAVIGAGGLGINAKIQRDKAEEAARIFSRPTWRSVLFSPRGIAVLLVIAVIGAGGLGINAKIQRDKAEEAARIEAKKEKERLAKQTVDLFSPRGIAVLLVIAVIGAGGLGINAKIQRDKAEEAARIEAKKEKERLAKQTVDPFKLGPTAIPVSTPRSQWTAGTMPHLYQTDPLWANKPYAERLAKQTVNPFKLGPTAIPVSTPRSQWTAGTMPHLYQTDPLWANKPYAGSNIRIAGCGPTSLSMVYTYLTGKTDLDPVAMASFAEERNFAPTGATEWRFMTDGAAAIGLRSTPVAPSRASIASALEAGMPIICCLTPGDFTTVGHFLVIKGMDSRGMVEIHDPNSPYNSARRWPISQIRPQIDALWALSL